MGKWKDETTYARGETDRTPRVWALRAHNLRLAVHRIHHLEGWFMSCAPFFKNRAMTASDDVEQLKSIAIERLRLCLDEARGELPATPDAGRGGE